MMVILLTIVASQVITFYLDRQYNSNIFEEPKGSYEKQGSFSLDTGLFSLSATMMSTQ